MSAVFRRNALRLLTALTVPMSVATLTQAAGWSDDFNDGNAEDGNPVTWTYNEIGVSPGIYDASSGDYTLSNPGGGSDDTLLPSVPATFTDVYTRTQGVILPAPGGQAGGQLGLVGRWNPAIVSGYLLYNDDGGTLGLRRVELGTPVDLVPAVHLGLNTATDLLLELNIVGDELSGYAWRPGDPKPATPQITATDNIYSSGRAGILFNEDDDGATGVFRFASAQDTPFVSPQWAANADGNWSLPANWTGGVPDGAGAVANFGPAITAPRTVTVDAPHTVGTINFDNPNRYTIAGPASLTLAGGGINVTGGSHTVSAPLVMNGSTSIDVSGGNTLTITGQMTGAAGIGLTKTGGGTLTLGGSNGYTGTTTVESGTLRVNSAASAPILAAGAAGADVQSGRLEFDYVGGSSPAANVRSLLKASHSTGFTSGQIRSTTIQPKRALGYADNGAGQVTVMYTVNGDANLSGDVTIADVNIAKANFGGTGDVWATGDFNYDDVTTIADINVAKARFGNTLPLMAENSGGRSAARQADGSAGPDQIELIVNVLTGQVHMVGNDPDPGEITSYEVRSLSGSLNVQAGGYNSLADQGRAGWGELPGTQFLFGEDHGFTADAVSLAGFSLGNLFTPGMTQNLEFHYGDEKFNTIAGVVTYVPEPSSVGWLSLSGIGWLARGGSGRKRGRNEQPMTPGRQASDLNFGAAHAPPVATTFSSSAPNGRLRSGKCESDAVTAGANSDSALTPRSSITRSLSIVDLKVRWGRGAPDPKADLRPASSCRGAPEAELLQDARLVASVTP